MKRLLIGLSLALLLAACASKDPVKETKIEDRTPPKTTASTTPPPSTQATQGQQAVNPLKDPNNPLSKRVIYFEYDKDVVKPEYTSLVQAHASYLGQNRNRKVRLEGHADERGSREYNMALGQRRADAVRKATAVLGVGGERIETISFGEDKPKSSGHDEAAWAQNRRVEILYDGE
ncbi:MAG: peptidoglycan-associated lipoprotein Pal [Betaproteobacteria bacterium]|nr:peptidoglycan-associated lipoprotein Pal [Betaproteobacteria bacterium]